jgi:hypothetical protein
MPHRRLITRLITVEAFCQELREIAEEFGGVRALAQHYGCRPSFLYSVLRGTYRPTARILAPLNARLVPMVEVNGRRPVRPRKRGS